MKYLLIALLLFPLITFAQHPKPPKKASVIVIQSSLDSATIALTEAGYIVINGAGKSIYTEPKALPPGSVKLFAVQKDSLIYLRGESRDAALAAVFKIDTFTQITCSGMKGSSARQAWDALFSAASKIGTITNYLVD